MTLSHRSITSFRSRCYATRPILQFATAGQIPTCLCRHGSKLSLRTNFTFPSSWVGTHTHKKLSNRCRVKTTPLLGFSGRAWSIQKFKMETPVQGTILVQEGIRINTDFVRKGIRIKMVPTHGHTTVGSHKILHCTINSTTTEILVPCTTRSQRSNKVAQRFCRR
jgi:hypothetical protein